MIGLESFKPLIEIYIEGHFNHEDIVDFDFALHTDNGF